MRSAHHVVYKILGTFLTRASGSGEVSEVAVGLQSASNAMVCGWMLTSGQAQDLKRWYLQAWSWCQVEVPVLQAVVQLVSRQQKRCCCCADAALLLR